MKFTRENYELYVLDYLEGKLTDNDYELFLQFLKENPDISYEIEVAGKIQLQPVDIKFHSKNSLKKNGRLSKFDDEFDNLCIAFIEGDLELNERKKIESWLSDNTEKLIEFELFRKSKLIAGKSITFSPKSKLKRLTLIQKRIRLISVISAAAVIILAVIFSVNKGFMPNNLITKKADTDIKIQPITEDSGDETMTNVNDSQSTDNQQRHLYSSSEIIRGNVPDKKDIRQPDDLLKSEREQIEIQPVSSAFALVEIKNSYDLYNLKMPASEPSLDFDSYQTLGQFAGNKILRSLLPGDDSVKSTKITFWDLASSGFKELNQITDGGGYALNKETDNSGKLKRISVETPLIGFSIPIKNRQPQ